MADSGKPSPNGSQPFTSPLKQQERPAVLKSKFETAWERILSPSPLSQEPPTFFADLFCLTVKPEVITAKIDKETASSLLSRRSNLCLFFKRAVDTLRSSHKTDIRRTQAIESILPFLNALLRKPFPNFNFDVISLLCGSLEQSDVVLSSLVTALDGILRDSEYPPHLRRRTLEVILVMTCQIGQGSLVSYFLRRDFFSTLCSFITSPEAPGMDLEALLLLGALANYHKFESRSARLSSQDTLKDLSLMLVGTDLYLMRLEDLVEEEMMRKVISFVTGSLTRSQQAYVDVEDDAPVSYLASLTSLVVSLQLSDFWPGHTARDKQPGSSTSSSVNNSSASERAFAAMPPSEAVLLLFPFYDLLHRNKLFFSLVLDEQQKEFLPAFFCFASYALCHASTSTRARGYGRLCLYLMTLLAEDDTVAMLASNSHVAQVRLCRQRRPQLPFANDQQRPLLCAMLDDTLIYLRHNLQKVLDVEGYLLAVQLVHKVLHGLKTAHIRLEYDWVAMWTALVALGTFLVNKMDSLKSLPDIDNLVAQILVTLDFACVWSDSLFPHAKDSTMLFYEVLRAEHVIKDLGDLTGFSGIQTSPRKGNSAGASSSAPAAESIRNLKAVIARFSTALDEHRESRGSSRLLEADEVLKVLERSADRGFLDLVESASLEDVRLFVEADHEASIKLLVREASQDVLTASGLKR